MVTIYLISSIKLTSKLKQHDQYTLLWQDAGGIDSLIFKHATSIIISSAPSCHGSAGRHSAKGPRTE